MSRETEKGKLVPLTIYTTGDRHVVGTAWIRPHEVVCYIDEESAQQIDIPKKGTLRAFSIVPEEDAKSISAVTSHPYNPSTIYRTT